ncbi:MAG TPA: hypothetical protein VLN49_17635 [Gemmatimonadaceae bacterium]|nr:hypothetical protein [Gemmatimonadaceae bacterium]
MRDSRARQLVRDWTIGRARTLVALATVVGVVACGDSTGPNGQKSPEGNYTIATVNGKAVPAPIFSDTGGYMLEITSGRLSLTGDGKYSSVIGFRQTLPGNVSSYTDSTGGTWVRSGGTVQFTETSTGLTASAMWGSGQITFVDSTSGPSTISLVYALKR